MAALRQAGRFASKRVKGMRCDARLGALKLLFADVLFARDLGDRLLCAATLGVFQGTSRGWNSIGFLDPNSLPVDF